MIQMNEMQQLLKKLEGTPEGNLLKQMMGQSRLLTRSTPGFKQIEKAQNIITKDGMDTDVYYDKPYLLTTRNQRYLDTTLPNGADSAFTILVQEIQYLN
jgi:hypothetical protein